LQSGTLDQTVNQTIQAPVREIGAFEAKSKLGQLLDWVEAGEEASPAAANPSPA
jgi:hypothetical protein